jgi:CIC family chloride channel protein
MSACLGAVVWAPVTGILIVFEMTHEFALVPVLMIGALVSQAISRRMNRQNFYDSLLTQDNHHIEHVRPPRDLQTWQQLPVSLIANFRPIVIRGLRPSEIQEVLSAHRYQRFPVVENSRISGMLLRKEAEAALAQSRPPKLEPATTCLPSQSIGDLQALFIESTTESVIVVDQPGGNVLGLVTLHDLLRAQVEKTGDGEG